MAGFGIGGNADFGRIAQEEGVAANLLPLAQSIYQQETHSGQNVATSPRGAVGPMQVTPATFQDYHPNGDIHNPADNIRAGLRKIKSDSEFFNGDPQLTAAAYHAGRQAVVNAGNAVPDTNDGSISTADYADAVTQRLPKQEDTQPQPLPEPAKPPTWDDIRNDPRLKDAAPEVVEGARKQYFNRLIMPKLQPDEIDGAWKRFDELTNPSMTASAKRTIGNAVDATTGAVSSAAKATYGAAGAAVDKAKAAGSAVGNAVQARENPVTPGDVSIDEGGFHTPDADVTAPTVEVPGNVDKRALDAGLGPIDTDALSLRVRRTLEASTPEEREAFAQRPDYVGQLARDQLASWQKHDQQAEQLGHKATLPGAPGPVLMSSPLEGMTDRWEDRALALRKDGMSSEDAEREAKAQAALAIPPHSEGSISPSDLDFEGQKGAKRVWNDWQSGMVGTTGSILSYAGRSARMGIDDRVGDAAGFVQDLGEAMSNWADKKMPVEPTLTDKMVSNIAGMTNFYLGGVGVRTGAEALSMLGPAAAKWAGAAGDAALMAASSANEVYHGALGQGLSEKEAKARANHDFYANALLFAGANRVAFFNDLTKLGEKVTAAAATNAPLMATQQVIQNYFLDRPLGEGTGEAALMGATAGAAVVGAHHLAGKLPAPAEKPAPVHIEPVLATEPTVGGKVEPAMGNADVAAGNEPTMGAAPEIKGEKEPVLGAEPDLTESAKTPAIAKYEPVAGEPPPWEIPRKAFYADKQRPITTPMPLYATADPHKFLVEQALESGEPVPKDVLADYPALAAQYPQKEEPATAAKPVTAEDKVAPLPGKQSSETPETPEIVKPEPVTASRLEALAQAGKLSRSTGTPHEVTPNPDEPGKWLVQPKEGPQAEEAPQSQIAKEYAQLRAKDQPLADPEVRGELESMAKNAGRYEVGGKMVRDEEGNVTGRTSWIPKEEWWPGRPDKLNPAQVQEAVRKALAGEPLKVAEKRTLDYMLESAQQRLKTSESLSQVGLPVNEQNLTDHAAVKQADSVDKGAVDRLRIQYPDDDATFMASIREVIHGNESAKTGAVGETGTGERVRGGEVSPLPGGKAEESGAVQADRKNPNESLRTGGAKAETGTAGAATGEVKPKSKLAQEYEAAKAKDRPPIVAQTPVQAGVSTSTGREVERFAGQYGKGLTEFNAKRVVKERSAEKPDLDWRAEPAPEHGPDRFAVVGREKPTPVDEAAHEAATSPTNALPEPTKAQIEANNSKLGHPRINGLTISIENPSGSIREDKHNEPPQWRQRMESHYGYIARVDNQTAPRGKDKEHVDVFVKPGTPEDYNGPVFVIDQKKPGNGHFDEHKAMIGFPDEEAARAGYQENYSKDWDGIRAITPMSFDEFKTWLKEGDTTRPANEAADAKQAPAFSRNRGVPVEDLNAIVQGIKAHWKGAPPIHALFGHDEAPQSLQDEIAKSGGPLDHAGAFHNGETYLFGKHLADEAHAQRVAVHELTHYGLEGLLGDDLGPVMMRIWKDHPGVQLEASRLMNRYHYSRVTAVNEVLANMGGKMGSSGQRPNWWQKLTAAVRDSLRRYGFNLKMNDADVASLVDRALQYSRKPRTDMTHLYRTDYARDSKDHFPHDVLTELAAHDELFRHPVSQKSTLRGVFEDVMPGAKYYGEHSRIDENAESGADHRYVFTTENGKTFYVYERGNKVWIDVSRLSEGDFGQSIYAAVSNYAHNARKVFVGDPNGLSESAVIRRTSNMLSSALRFGTTRHLEAASEQVKGDPDKGIAPLDWSGDDVAKTSALIHTFLTHIEGKFPQLRDYRYDFNTGQFVDAKSGRPLGPTWAAVASRQGVARSSRAGETTLRRAVFLQSLASSEGGARPGILEQALSRGRQLVERGDLKSLFSRGDEPEGQQKELTTAEKIAKEYAAAKAPKDDLLTPYTPAELKAHEEAAKKMGSAEPEPHYNAEGEQTLPHDSGSAGTDVIDPARLTDLRRQAAALEKNARRSAQAPTLYVSDLSKAVVSLDPRVRSSVPASYRKFATNNGLGLIERAVSVNAPPAHPLDRAMGARYAHEFRALLPGRETPGDTETLFSRSDTPDEKLAKKYALAKAAEPTEPMPRGKLAREYTLTKDAHKAGAVFSRTDALGEAEAQSKDNWLKAHYLKAAKKVIDFTDRLSNPLVDIPGQNDYLKHRQVAMGVIGSGNDVVKEIRNVFHESTPEDRQAAFDYFTTEGATPAGIRNEKVRNGVQTIKDAINHVSDQLVDKGIINAESREEFRDRYLPQLYLRHLLEDSGWKVGGSGKKTSDMGYTKGRKLEQFRNADGEVRLRDKATGKELSDQEVLKLGPVTDPEYLASVALARPMRDMAILDWLESISKDERWVLPNTTMKWNGKNVSPYFLKTEADRLRRQANYYEPEAGKRATAYADKMDAAANKALESLPTESKGFTQIPNSGRYGAMRGIWVRSEIYHDLVGNAHFQPNDMNWFQNLFGVGGVGTKFTQMWKGTKTYLNPPGQVRNFVTNMTQLQLSGVPFHSLPSLMIKTIGEMKNQGRYFQEFKTQGGETGTFANEDLGRMQRELLDMQHRSGELSTWGQLHRAAAIVTNKAGDVWQANEVLGKLMKFIHERERGASPGDAMIEANKTLFDYSLVQPWIRYARSVPFGIPFATWSSKVLPRLTETAVLHPQRYLPYIAAFYGAQYALASMLGVTSDDLDKLKKAMPQWLWDHHNAMLMPWKDDKGRWQVMDLSYFMPWQQWGQLANDTAHGDVSKSLQDIGAFGGPIPNIISAISTQQDPFTHRDIAHKGDPPAQQAASWLNYAWSLAAPPFLTDNGALGHAIRAYSGNTNKYGDPLDTPTQALLRPFGINLYALTPEQTQMANVERMKYDVNDSERELKTQLMDRSLSPEQKDTVRNRYRDEIQRREGKINQYLEDSKIAPALRTGH